MIQSEQQQLIIQIIQNGAIIGFTIAVIVAFFGRR